MNYYNPYFYSMPNIASSTSNVGVFSRLFGPTGLSLSRIFNGTQKALNFANQAIPFVKQVKPMIGNAKTMFRVMNEFKKSERPNNNYQANNSYNMDNSNYNTKDTSGGPTFFK